MCEIQGGYFGEKKNPMCLIKFVFRVGDSNARGRQGVGGVCEGRLSPRHNEGQGSGCSVGQGLIDVLLTSAANTDPKGC